MAAALPLLICRRDGRGLAHLLRELSALPTLRWMRILYAYPSYFDNELIEEIATNPKVGLLKRALQPCLGLCSEGSPRL